MRGGTSAAKPKGSALLETSVAVADLVLVERAFAQPGDEQFPEAAGDVLAHGMAAAVPGVEVADHADAGGVGGPDGEVHPVHAVDRAQFGAEPVVALPVPAFVQQMQVVVGQQVRKGVGVVHGDLPSPFVGHAEQVAGACRWSRAPGKWPRTVRPDGSAAWAAPASPWAGSTTQASVDCGKNARTANARRPESFTSCGPRSQRGFRAFPQ